MIPKLPEQRYIITPVGDSGDYVIADARDMGDPRLFMLTVTPRLGDPQNNWTFQIGSFNPLNYQDENGPPVGIEVLIWECAAYLGKSSAARSMGEMILISLEQEEIEINHPYELAFRFGGQVLPYP